MNKLLTLKNQIFLLLFLVIMSSLSTCSSCNAKREVTRLKKETTVLHSEIDSLNQRIATREDIEKMLKVEGLKSEKRMIQSTDRKIMDVNRQSEIDRELETLQK